MGRRFGGRKESRNTKRGGEGAGRAPISHLLTLKYILLGKEKVHEAELLV